MEARLRRVAAGLDDTYLAMLADGRRIALRIGSTMEIRRPAAMKVEAAWMRQLQTSPVDVPRLSTALAGGDVAVIADDAGCERGCLAVEWLPGRKARRRFTVGHAALLGGVAAHLHASASTLIPPEDGWVKAWTPERMSGTGRRDGLEKVAGRRAAAVADEIRSRLHHARGELGDAEWMLINADLGPHNTVWRDGRPLLFDFNDVGWGYAGFDFARYLRGLRTRDNGADLVNASVAGYESVRPLPESWKTHGDLFEAAAGVFLASYLAPKVPERGQAAVDAITRLLDSAARFLDRG